MAGSGIKAVVAGVNVAAGNEKLMAAVGIEAPQVKEPGTVIHVAFDGEYRGHILISDKLKSTS